MGNVSFQKGSESPKDIKSKFTQRLVSTFNLVILPQKGGVSTCVPLIST